MIIVTVEQMREMLISLSDEERAALIAGMTDDAVRILDKLFPGNPVIRALIALKAGA